MPAAGYARPYTRAQARGRHVGGRQQSMSAEVPSAPHPPTHAVSVRGASITLVRARSEGSPAVTAGVDTAAAALPPRPATYRAAAAAPADPEA